MPRWLRAIGIIGICAALIIGIPWRSNAEPSLDETKQLLQKGLNIYEIDQEVARLSEKQKQISEQIRSTESSIAKQQTSSEETKRRAGHVLRAYYTGERTSIWMTLLTADSFSDALDIFEYLKTIYVHDHDLLKDYSLKIIALKRSKEELVQTQTNLQQVKDQFLAQRTRALALQKELDDRLREQEAEDAFAIQDQITKLTDEWQERGLPLFKQYFSSLSAAMKNFPDLFKEHPELLVTEGKTASFQISDKLLNDFLRKQNPEMFNTFAFKFKKGKMIAEGSSGDIDVSIIGKYVLEEEPKNAIRYMVDELIYKGYSLPDTTRASLQKQFNLVFYPNKVFSYLVATGVEMEEGKLKVSLKINFKL